MNCQAVQNRILTLPDPRHLPETLRDHLAGCTGCREWARQAARLEGLLTQLPVPAAPADKKAELIEELTRPEPLIIRPPTVSARPGYTLPVWRFLQRNARVVGGLAAAVLVALGGWWFLTHNGTPEIAARPTPKDPFVEKLVQRDIALAKSTNPKERLRALGGLADDLSTQTRTLARVANPNDLNELAGLFDKVVKSGLTRQADQIATMPEYAMPPKEKQELYSALAKKLGDMATEADKLAGEVPPEAKPACRRSRPRPVRGRRSFSFDP